ncbi:MAG TPA: protein kinase [Stackebrandtia sp.]|jgi:serine/threonine protein kinase|uniref:serine/threonine-protein kinase n=1 Tax=Stackebrandtia sp. TaxID=2023065 RepID=UPI002D665C1E|nr:protein kinase [Stackebrandtia sp.]HZE37910.1 protein kinase [Stackebrandtia sp.]
MRPGQMLDERYRLEAEAGNGGMGTVWRAKDVRIERTVALKVLHPHLARDEEFRLRFAREARAVGAVRHPGVVGLYDFVDTTIDDEPVAYLVMEYAEGTSLREILNDRGTLSAAEALPLMASVAEALDAAHQHGIVHRDIKPSNILVRGDTVKLVDFGISQSYGDGDITSTGRFMGSLPYVSPEQLQGERITSASDVYALGVVTYETLSGKLPYAGNTPASLLTGHLHHDPTPLPDEVPSEVAEVVMRALAKRPAERHGTAAEFAEACRAVHVDPDTAAVPVPRKPKRLLPPTTLWSRPKRRRWPKWTLAAALALVLAASGGGLVWYLNAAATNGNDPDSAAGVSNLHKLAQHGDPVAFDGQDDTDRGDTPEPVTADGVAYFAQTDDDGSFRATAVDLATGKRKWTKPIDSPVGLALRAGHHLLYTADTDAGVLNFLDPATGSSRKIVDLDGGIEIKNVGSRVVAFVKNTHTVTAFNADGTQAWTQDYDSTVVGLDTEATWKDFTAQPGRASPQDPKRLLVHGADGTVWRVDAASGDAVSSASTDAGGTVATAFQGMMFDAKPNGDGTYTVTMRDIAHGFAEKGRWESLRSGHNPLKIVQCGKTRVCVRDDKWGATGAVIIDFAHPDAPPLWQNDGDEVVSDIYAAGTTTAVIDYHEGAYSTQLLDAKLEPLGGPKPGVFRPIDRGTFLDYPRAPGNDPSLPIEKHFFTGLDAADASTRELGMRQVFPQCVTEGTHLACPTPDGITVWQYRGGKAP